MDFIVNKKSGGVLYIDEDIICIKRSGKYLEVYQFLPSYKKILTLELSRRTNKIGRYKQGIYYFQDRSTYFHSFTNGEERKEEGRFYYKLKPEYNAYTTFENKDSITFESDDLFEVPILQQGGQKLFLDNGLIQADQKSGRGSIVYHSFSKCGGESWRRTYSELTESDKAILHSQILSFNGKLFFVIDGNDNRGLFVLDTETGQVLKKFEGLCYEVFHDEEYIYTTKFENVLCRINTKALELEEWDCNTVVKETGLKNIHDHRCAVINGKFCFTQSLGDYKAKIGVLDWEKKELVYKYDFEPQSGAIGSIQASESRIFVHTQDNILHIFEKRVN